MAARQRISPEIQDIETEFCFNIEAAGGQSRAELETLAWLLCETFQPEGFGLQSSLDGDGEVLEVGPRMNFSTAWSTNAVSICHACGLTRVRRIERSRRYLLRVGSPLNDELRAAFLAMVHDRMTETPYAEPLQSFETGLAPAPVLEIPVLEEGSTTPTCS
jgi:phosphoribosylformylglycinamidine synthase